MIDTWLDLTSFHTRFVSDDTLSTILQFIYTLGILGMAVHFSQGLDDIRGFVVSLSITRLALIALYTKVWLSIERARVFVSYIIAGLAISSFIQLMAAFTIPTTHSETGEPILWGRIALWAIIATSYLITVYTISLTYRDKKISIPINVEHTAERCGLFVMLLLGESVITVIEPSLNGNSREYGVIALGFAICFCIKVSHSVCVCVLVSVGCAQTRNSLLCAVLCCVFVCFLAPLSLSHTTQKQTDFIF